MTPGSMISQNNFMSMKGSQNESIVQPPKGTVKPSLLDQKNLKVMLNNLRNNLPEETK